MDDAPICSCPRGRIASVMKPTIMADPTAQPVRAPARCERGVDQATDKTRPRHSLFQRRYLGRTALHLRPTTTARLPCIKLAATFLDLFRIRAAKAVRALRQWSARRAIRGLFDHDKTRAMGSQHPVIWRTRGGRGPAARSACRGRGTGVVSVFAGANGGFCRKCSASDLVVGIWGLFYRFSSCAIASMTRAGTRRIWTGLNGDAKKSSHGDLALDVTVC